MIRRFVLLVAALALLGCAPATSPDFPVDAAWRYLVTQCDYGPRVPGSAAHDSTLRFIAQHLQRRGAKVVLQRFEVDDPYGTGVLRLTNIVGSYAPEAKRRILLMAHWDCRPWADQELVDSLKTKPVPGANDAASGVATLLAVADVLSTRMPKGIGVDLALFDGEDYGKSEDLQHYLLGSKYFAANLGGYRPECAILLDMVAGADAEFRQEGNSLDMAAELTHAVFARAAELELDRFVAERYQHIYDDHVPFLRAGVPSLDLIGLPYRYWHTVSDTPDQCSQAVLDQVGTLLVDFVFRYPL